MRGRLWTSVPAGGNQIAKRSFVTNEVMALPHNIRHIVFKIKNAECVEVMISFGTFATVKITFIFRAPTLSRYFLISKKSNRIKQRFNPL